MKVTPVTYQILQVKRVVKNHFPTTRTWNTRPLPPDIQPIEFNNNQLSVSADKTYELNIDNLSE